MTASVTLDNVTISYDRHPAVHHVSGTFEAGSLTAITGPNGAGKSTLLKAIAGVITPQEGRISASGRLAYLSQVSDMQRDFPISVLQMAACGFWHDTRGTKPITSAMKEKAAKALADVGLRGFERRSIGSLSVGQFQRALFARLLLEEADLMLLDEPFNAIDESTTALLTGIIQRWHREKRTVICVLHDLEQIRRYFPRTLLLARECIAWGDTGKALHPENLLGTRLFHGDWNNAITVCERAV